MTMIIIIWGVGWLIHCTILEYCKQHTPQLEGQMQNG
jgi:hypothetical protein